ncbi:acyltransferase [Streptococcus suis]|uniref:acyltransferase n=1 Tax=Streptococcus TaxID=1301 RepID=UPI001552FDDE|nr:acyltransferase [Streptococcus suis]NQO39322.1 acyltransferase [Streptococcus suis]NQP23473.1 acyltransferase [Streptococcus suis]NQP24697.1 acyltransferase [Streptococcus suis]
MENQKSFEINYAMLSLFQYIFAVLVILLHSQRIFENDWMHFIQKSIFSRMAVPFFIVSTSFFIQLNTSTGKSNLVNYLSSSLRVYLFLSLLYLPYAFFFFVRLGYSPFLLPFATLFALFYSGTAYHLWYFPALFLGLLIVDFLKKQFSSRLTFFICLLLFLIGSIETYSGYLKDSCLIQFYNLYRDFFFTSRNGFFFVPIFVYLGQLVYSKKDYPFLNSYPITKLILSFVLFLIEAYFIFLNQGYDKNFFYTLIPFTLFLFNWVIRSSLFTNKKWYKLKLFSIYYFFYHPIFIELGFLFVHQYQLENWQNGILVASFTLIMTHCVSLALYKKNRKKSLGQKDF